MSPVLREFVIPVGAVCAAAMVVGVVLELAIYGAVCWAGRG